MQTLAVMAAVSGFAWLFGHSAETIFLAGFIAFACATVLQEVSRTSHRIMLAVGRVQERLEEIQRSLTDITDRVERIEEQTEPREEVDDEPLFEEESESD